MFGLMFRGETVGTSTLVAGWEQVVVLYQLMTVSLEARAHLPKALGKLGLV